MAEQTKFNRQDAEDLLRELQKFNNILNYEWIKVLRKWETLQSCWHDKQFEEFEPLFQKFKANYQDAENKSEEFIRFIQEQITISEERQRVLSNFQRIRNS
ncbi:hypothetical protein WEU38_11755 [Cyanobacterium aponinum AL20118]|uniref:Uncharacterized protein n=3 Tax=Cyanobacterium aponinum TaxID=379064 RepID=K9Z1H9_CYAAP|nr:hypothetical protein [Cyanobacterium aponinum]AFZ52435.1 hypothetical protein Cyan10605_0286 [Cyanobacterium aponinum PCC 10605]MTF37638.1 hypothetical protein [Cyanobacterium aponinum 0216]PHV61475.1 hypothetical protein CSQ80_15450 [Cyanobacterium aponinum IPPAS B-1201]WPF87485.1 hypothetical protein SAY89_11785 [Cyanobacterium aponinum AL20115]